MTKAVLLSGDKDFRPLVESLVRLGLFIEVAADQNHISSDLIHSADSNTKLSVDEYFEFCPNETQKQKPIEFLSLSFFIDRAESDRFWLKQKSRCKDFDVFVFTDSQARYMFTTSNTNIHNNSAWKGNIESIKQYFELKFGQVDWE